MAASWALLVFGLLAEGLSNLPTKKQTLDSTASNEEASKPTPERCSVLQNTQNAVYTINVDVGTPKQTFRLVADTGSNVLVIPGKNCKSCEAAKKNLYDHGKSSTSHTTNMESKITYGSGPVTGDIIHDNVHAIGVTSENQSMLVMHSQNIENFAAFSFDGIMGMGMPVSAMGTKDEPAGEDKSFFAQAGVNAFTMCFAKGEKPDGVLKLGSKRNATFSFERVIGQVHWGVQLSSSSIKGQQIPGICDGSKHCAVIVDSGTTLIMAPSHHLVSLYSKLCDHLPECAEGAQGTSNSMIKSDLFLTTLLTCPDDMANLPDLEFHLGDTDLALGPDTYIMKAHSKDIALHGFFDGMNYTFAHEKYSLEVCVPAFMAGKMMSRNHGPIWIFGMPLMREYTVMFNRNEAGFPLVGFSKTIKCNGCGDGEMISRLYDVEPEGLPITKFYPALVRKPNLVQFEDEPKYIKL